MKCLQKKMFLLSKLARVQKVLQASVWERQTRRDGWEVEMVVIYYGTEWWGGEESDCFHIFYNYFCSYLTSHSKTATHSYIHIYLHKNLNTASNISLLIIDNKFDLYVQGIPHVQYTDEERKRWEWWEENAVPILGAVSGPVLGTYPAKNEEDPENHCVNPDTGLHPHNNLPLLLF